jgi:putative endonuclease
MGGKPPAKQKLKAYRRGWLAEYWAALYLLMKGYRILAMRYRARSGEIDIIARKKDLIAFVEVKARKNERDALSAVGARTRHRIHAASRIWLSKQEDASQLSWRYDIIAIRPLRIPLHFKGAF